MSLVEIKLKEGSSREKLMSTDGKEINKKKYTVVDDKDPYVESFLTYRNDLLIRDHKEIIKSSGKSKTEETFKE